MSRQHLGPAEFRLGRTKLSPRLPAGRDRDAMPSQDNPQRYYLPGTAGYYGGAANARLPAVIQAITITFNQLDEDRERVLTFPPRVNGAPAFTAPQKGEMQWAGAQNSRSSSARRRWQSWVLPYRPM